MANEKVTLKDVYEINSEVLDKMDHMRSEIMQCVKENSVRITTLEYWKANITGKIAVVVGVITIALSVVVDWFKKKLDL